MQHCKRLHEYYPELYQGGGDSSQDIADFGKKWNWYQNIYSIARGNVFEFERATKLKLGEALLYLSFEADKNKLESKMIKKGK